MTLYNFNDAVNDNADGYDFAYIPSRARPNSTRALSHVFHLSAPDLKSLRDPYGPELDFLLVYLDDKDHADAQDGIHALRGTFRRSTSFPHLFESDADNARLHIAINRDGRGITIVEFANHPLSPYFTGTFRLNEIGIPIKFDRKINAQDCKVLLEQYHRHLHPLIALSLEGKRPKGFLKHAHRIA